MLCSHPGVAAAVAKDFRGESQPAVLLRLRQAPGGRLQLYANASCSCFPRQKPTASTMRLMCIKLLWSLLVYCGF